MDSVTGSKGVIARRFGTLSVVSSLDFGSLATVEVGCAGIKDFNGCSLGSGGNSMSCHSSLSFLS